MWYQDIEENGSSHLNDTEEEENVPYEMTSPPMSPLLGFPEENRVNNFQYMQSPPMSPLLGFPDENANTASESDDSDSSAEIVTPDTETSSSSSSSAVDCLLFKSLESYIKEVKDKMIITKFNAPYGEQVLSVRTSDELNSSTVLRPPRTQVLWPRSHRDLLEPDSSGRSSSDSDTDDDQTQSDDDSSSDDRGDSLSTEPDASTIRFTCELKLPFFSEKALLQNTLHPSRRLSSVRNMPQPTLLARQVANRVIRYARCARNVHEEDMCCLSCGFFPIRPVTGSCGHTRCTKCIITTPTCPCGSHPPSHLCINILIRDLIGKTVDGRNPSGIGKSSTTANTTPAPANRTPAPANKLLFTRGSSIGPIRNRRLTYRHNCTVAPTSEAYQRHVPMTARTRFAHALELLNAGMHMDAAPQLALTAASELSDARAARNLLAQVIVLISNNRDPRGLTRELNQSVRRLSSMAGIKTGDMECILCCDILIKPVTTPCGHMFCRTCLEKTLDYEKRCPLCLHDLSEFKLAETNDTLFIKGALASINALSVPKPMEEADLVPIFVCTVAYPSISCPLFIFDRRYWMMIRRVLESGSRRFGMVAMDREKKYADYGTILEVRDCIQFEDGRSILSTIGLTRFKVIERCVREGCEVARIQTIQDTPADYSVAYEELRMYSSRIMLKALLWLSNLGTKVLCDIENAFGSIPTQVDDIEEWMESTDGPAWLWWLVAVLPLRLEIKVLILSTDCLLKRMMAVDRTLDAVARVTVTTMAPGQCQLRVTMPTNDPI